ncbi:MAG: rolling circle replication-associated protein [bacterium]
MLMTVEEIKENNIRKLFKKLRLLEKYVKEKGLKKEFLTITFRNNEQYLIFRDRKLDNMLRNFKKNYGLDSYFWVVEFQKRGVIHYHFLLLLKEDRKIGFVDKKEAYKEYVGYTNIRSVYTSITKYLTKYITKSIKERKPLVIRDKVLKNYRKVRYRQYSIGGKIRKVKEYKEICKRYIDKKIDKLGLKRQRKDGLNEIEYMNKKIRYRYNVNFSIEGLNIYNCKIEVYKKYYKNLYEYEYKYEYVYDIEIETKEQIKMVYKIIELELGIELGLN